VATQVVQVGSVWPTGSTLTITGQATTGQAITGATVGASFGTVTARTVWTQPVGGVQTAQAFGQITTSQSFTIHPVGIPSAQAFGAITTRVGGQAVTPTPVPSAAAFGVPKFIQKVTVAGIGSAQQFGSSLKINQSVQVKGFYPYPDDIPSITGAVICGDGHLVGGYGGTNWQFGRITIHAQITVAVAGVPSAAAFGQIKVVQLVQVPGVPSAQQFGLKLGWKITVWGIPSAQQFGTGWRVFLVWMREAVCTDLDLDPSACIVSGGRSILNTFRCGDGTVISGGQAFLDDPTEDDLGLAASVCLADREGAAILNTFRCGDGTRIGQGEGLFLDEAPVLTLDLQPAGCT